MILNDAELKVELTERFRRLQLRTNADGEINLQDIRLWTDELKKLAWCRLYALIQGESNAKAQAMIKST